MQNAFLLLLAASSAMLAQSTVAPTPESVGRARGENIGGYNVTNSFETGVRFHTAGGNRNRYRSDINYGNGVRLLSSSLTVNSKNGHGRWFDEILLHTLGLGNDPYQYASLRLQQNRWYRYDLTFRMNEYFNPGLTTGSLGGHFANTRRQMQDHEFVLFPNAAVRFFAGYSRNSQDGPALSSIQAFDSRGDEFALFTGVDRRQSEVRGGFEVRASGFKLIAIGGSQHFREKASATSPAQAGANPDDLAALRSFSRKEPYEGETPFWRFHLLSERKTWYSVSARFSYAGGRRNFSMEELAGGADRRGSDRNRQILVAGSGRRPVSSGSVTFGLFPSRRWTITNHTTFQQVAMDGNSSYQEWNNATLGLNLVRFQYLGIRGFSNATDASFQAARWIGFYGGYHDSTRRIRSREGATIEGTTNSFFVEQNSRIHAGLAGIRLQPARPVTLNLTGEAGRSDRPIYPTSDRRYHALGARAQYKTKSLLLAASTRAAYNNNSVSLFVHSARSRTHAIDASWTLRSWLSFDTGYSKLEIHTLTGLAYFATDFIQGDSSLYVSNIHAGSLGLHLSVQKRADVYVGYSRVQDAGDGRSAAAIEPGRQVSALGAIRAAQTFPLVYQSPQMRLSLRLRDKLRWNFGYQHYGYSEDFFLSQNYRAHTGYTSVLWSF